jgi:hypothetical protein
MLIATHHSFNLSFMLMQFNLVMTFDRLAAQLFSNLLFNFMFSFLLYLKVFMFELKLLLLFYFALHYRFHELLTVICLSSYQEPIFFSFQLLMLLFLSFFQIFLLFCFILFIHTLCLILLHLFTNLQSQSFVAYF